MPSETLIVDNAGTIMHVGPGASTLSGYPSEELLGQRVELLIASKYRDRHVLNRNGYHQSPYTRSMGEGKFELLTRQGRQIPVSIALSPIIVDDQSWVIAAIRAVDPESESEDVTLSYVNLLAARLASASLIAESEERFRRAVAENLAPMFLSAADGEITYVNRTFSDLIGRSEAEILGRSSLDFTHRNDVAIVEEIHSRMRTGKIGATRYEQRLLHRDGHVIAVESSRAPIRGSDGCIASFVTSLRDITENRALISQLHEQALHDPLTGLANRALLQERMSQARVRMTRTGSSYALLVLNLDDFKSFNDTYGHLAGDQVLIAVARRLERVTRASDTVCRVGSDEFLYLAEDLRGANEASEVAERLLGVFSETFTVGDVQFRQRASVGIALCDDPGVAPSEYLQAVNIALHEAKRNQRGAHVIFQNTMRNAVTQRFSLSQYLERALEHDELTMHYQPLVDLRTGQIRALEALIRWENSEHGWISPEVFVPIAEENGLIIDLGEFALRHAVTAAARWAGPGGPAVTVNFSPLQFHEDGVLGLIDQELRSSGLDPRRLIVEITESVALYDPTDTRILIARLRERGVRVAIDDFGTGYSSLSQLAQLRPSIIKVDRGFVSPPEPSYVAETLLDAAITLGNRLGITTVAEGIETRDQLKTLMRLQCRLGQGFLFSPAVPADRVPALLTRVFDGLITSMSPFD